MIQRVPLTVRLMDCLIPEGRSVQEVAHQVRSGLTKGIMKAPYLGFLRAIDLGPWSAVNE